MATPRKNKQQVELQRPIQNEKDFLELGEGLMKAKKESLQKSGYHGARLVSAPSASQGILSPQSRDNLCNLRRVFERDYEPTIRGIITDYIRHGQGNCFQFLCEISSSILADGYSWSGILFLILTIVAVIAAIGVFAVLPQIMSFLWCRVGPWIRSNGARIISAIA